MVVWVASTFGGNGLRRVVWRLTLFFFFLMLSSTLLLPLQCFKLILTAVSLEFWCKNCRYVMSLLFCLILRRLTVIDSLHVHYSTIRNLAIEVSVKIWFWFGVNMQYILLNILLSSYWLGKGSGLFFGYWSCHFLVIFHMLWGFEKVVLNLKLQLLLCCKT